MFEREGILSRHCRIRVVRWVCSALLVLFSQFVWAGQNPDGKETGILPDTTDEVALDSSSIEAQGAKIGEVLIDNENIFDLTDSAENSLFYRFANKVHIKTRPNLVRQQILFKPGDSYSQQLVDESERILRSNRYIQEATIEPIRYEGGVVDVRVLTNDVWTLNPSISFGRKGGANTGGVGIKEGNLFGTGIEVGASYKSGVDRDSKSFFFRDQHLGSSWVGLKLAYANNSDGRTRAIGVDRPFFSLDSRRAGGVALVDDDRVDPLYESGEVVSEFRHQIKSYESYGGWSSGMRDGWTRRYTAGVGYNEDLFSATMKSDVPSLVIPDDRKFVYPFIGLEIIQDRYQETKNQDQMNRTEDRFLGRRFRAKVGFASSAFGSTNDAWLLSASAQQGFGNLNAKSLFLESNFATRLENNGVRNLILNGSAKYYSRQSAKRLLYVGLAGTFGRNLDVDRQILLGGDNGLRGYPLRYQSGDKRLLFTIEQRFFSDWYPFHLFNVGGAVFFDAGRTWGSDALGSKSLGTLKDVGVGLRIGSTRSGNGRVMHIDLAFPLDGDSSIKNVQLLIEAKRTF